MIINVESGEVDQKDEGSDEDDMEKKKHDSPTQEVASLL